MTNNYSVGINEYVRRIEICLNISKWVFILSIIAYYISGIYILIDESFLIRDLYYDCNSKVWIYGLLSLFGFTDKLMLRKIDSLFDYSKIFYILFLIELILIIFGSIELWGKNCIYEHGFRSTKLYKFCLSNYIIQIIIWILLTLKIIFMGKSQSNQIQSNQTPDYDTFSDIDYRNQHYNRRQNILNNQNVSDNYQNISGNNQTIGGNNQTISGNNQNVNDNNENVIDNNIYVV